jgi:hypothetical protein
VTKNAGHNRFVWDVRHSSTLVAPPGQYTARLTVNDAALSTPLTVLIDPRLAREGMTVADLREQFDHNLKMREMVAEVGQVRQRIQATPRVRPPTPSHASVRSRRRWRRNPYAMAARGSRRRSRISPA